MTTPEYFRIEPASHDFIRMAVPGCSGYFVTGNNMSGSAARTETAFVNDKGEVDMVCPAAMVAYWQKEDKIVDRMLLMSQGCCGIAHQEFYVVKVLLACIENKPFVFLDTIVARMASWPASMLYTPEPDTFLAESDMPVRLLPKRPTALEQIEGEDANQTMQYYEGTLAPVTLQLGDRAPILAYYTDEDRYQWVLVACLLPAGSSLKGSVLLGWVLR